MATHLCAIQLSDLNTNVKLSRPCLGMLAHFPAGTQPIEDWPREVARDSFDRQYCSCRLPAEVTAGA